MLFISYSSKLYLAFSLCNNHVFCLKHSAKILIDYDECEESPCEQVCNNLEGGYQCDCREGYELVESGRCQGEHCHTCCHKRNSAHTSVFFGFK